MTKPLPDTQNTWRELSKLIGDGLRHQIFVAALRNKIFDHVDGSDAESIAASLGGHPRNTELFLNALAAMDLLRKRHGRYHCSAQAAEFLCSTSPTYLGESLLHMNSFYAEFPDLGKLLVEGPPPASGDLGDPAIWAESARRSAAYQYSGEAQHMARIVAALPEFAGMKRMLDLGGGSGFYTMAMVAAHPTMEGVIFEQPAVAEVAKAFVAEHGLEHRVSVIAGDYAQDGLQGPYDLVFASATLNFAKERFDTLFAKVHDALAPGGVFMTHQDGMRDERTRPANHITEFLLAEMMGGDFAILQGEIAEAMLRCGFQTVRSFTKTSNMGDMDVDIGRKRVA